jgi:hypothetical protein
MAGDALTFYSGELFPRHGDIGVSAITIVEIVYLMEKGRIPGQRTCRFAWRDSG